jgi:uncharacterized repeat protein (TIGR03803 family)
MKRFAAGRSRRIRVFPSPKVTVPRLLGRAAPINTHFAHAALKLHPPVEPDGGAFKQAQSQDSAGNLYGATTGGGIGFGMVFKLEPTAKETVLHTFTLGDGALPHANFGPRRSR